MYIVANQYIEKNAEITINHQAAVPFKRCNCGDPTTCTASINPVPLVTTPITIVQENSSSPLIDPTVSHSSDDDEIKLSQRNKRTRQQRSMKKTNKKIMKRATSKAETPPPAAAPLPSVKNKEPNGPGRPKSPIKKVETSPEPDINKSNNNDTKMVKRLNEMVIIFNHCKLKEIVTILFFLVKRRKKDGCYYESF